MEVLALPAVGAAIVVEAAAAPESAAAPLMDWAGAGWLSKLATAKAAATERENKYEAARVRQLESAVDDVSSAGMVGVGRGMEGRGSRCKRELRLHGAGS
jgi:hypothetical protein